MRRSLAFCVLLLATVLAPVALFASEATVASNKVLIVHDELPQMEILAKFLREDGGLDVTVVEQSALPKDWSAYRAVIAYIHRVLEVPTEKAIIAYTEERWPLHRAAPFHQQQKSGQRVLLRFSRYSAGQSHGCKEPGDAWWGLWMAGRDPDTGQSEP